MDRSSSQGRLAPAPTTCLPSQLLLLGSQQTHLMASTSTDSSRDSWAKGLLLREQRFLAGCQGRSWQQAACLVCCARINTLTSTMIYFAPASVPVLLSPFFSFKALEGGEGTRQLAGRPCKEQEGRSLEGERWALLLSVDLRREDRVVGSKRPPEPRTP